MFGAGYWEHRENGVLIPVLFYGSVREQFGSRG